MTVVVCFLAGSLQQRGSKKKNVFDLNKIKFFIILFKAFVDDDCWTCSEYTKRHEELPDNSRCVRLLSLAPSESL